MRVHAKVKLILPNDNVTGEREGCRCAGGGEGAPAGYCWGRAGRGAERVDVAGKGAAPAAADEPAADHRGGAEVGSDDLGERGGAAGRVRGWQGGWGKGV